MKILNILEAKEEALRFLMRIEQVRASDVNRTKFTAESRDNITYCSKETAALKRSSMDLTRSLSKLRNDVW